MKRELSVSRNLLLAMFMLPCLALAVLPADGQQVIPRDSTYTSKLAWQKIRKQYPETTIAIAPMPAGVKAIYDLEYRKLEGTPFGTRTLYMDVFRPEGKKRFPALLLIHGGGWRSGDRTMEHEMAKAVAGHGYVTATVEYRLSPEALYPAAVFDLKAAVRYLRNHAGELGILPGRIAVSGTSAGGQLAALVGLTGDDTKFDGITETGTVSSDVQAVIDIDGVVDFTDPNESGNTDPVKPSAGTLWFGATIKQAPQKWIEASPVRYAGKSSPPILFINSDVPRFHAGRDSLVAIYNRHGIYSEIHTLAGSPHTFWLFHPWFEPTVGFMVPFLDRILKNK